MSQLQITVGMKVVIGLLLIANFVAGVTLYGIPF